MLKKKHDSRCGAPRPVEESLNKITRTQRQIPEARRTPEMLVGVGFRCWVAGYDTGDIGCWETAWNIYATTLGPQEAKSAVAELACWVRCLCEAARRDLDYYPVGCKGYCHDECMAISLVAAAQHDRCPAMRACAFALLGSEELDPIMSATAAFGSVMRSSGQLLSVDSVGNAAGVVPASVMSLQ